MFTGIIEETGIIKKVNPIPGGKKIYVAAHEVLSDLKVDASIAVNGVCLTVVKVDQKGFWVEAVGETLEKTTLKSIKTKLLVNLERAVRMSDRLGGHLVQGHVNAVGKIQRIKKLGDNYALDIIVDHELEKYLILEGSITIDGISLTIARLDGQVVGINIIPHTWQNTNMKLLQEGDFMNVEVDVIAKYIEKMLAFMNKDKKNKLSWDYLKKIGY